MVWEDGTALTDGGRWSNVLTGRLMVRFEMEYPSFGFGLVLQDRKSVV